MSLPFSRVILRNSAISLAAWADDFSRAISQSALTFFAINGILSQLSQQKQQAQKQENEEAEGIYYGG